MKKLFFLLMLSCTVSIAVAQNALASKEITVFNLSTYYERGLFITESNSVNFDYKPIALLQCVLKDGYSHKKDRTVSARPDKNIRKKDDGTLALARRPQKGKDPEPELYKYSIYDALDEFEIQCKELKADVIFNLKVQYLSEDEFLVTGMAVKRVD